jgi:hypothetical protein
MVLHAENGNEEGDKITANVKLACSVGTFRSTNIESYRDRILKSLEQMLCVATRETKSGNDEDDHGDDHNIKYQCYDAYQINRSLSSIEWKDLCEHHDEHISRAYSKKRGKQSPMTSSPLEEVISAVVNPTIIPRCCAALVIQSLVRAFLQSPRARRQTKDYPPTSRWTPAQSTFLQCIGSLYAECPSAGFKSMQYFLSEEFDSTAVSNEWNRLLSLAQNLAKDILRAHFGLASVLVDLIRRMDGRELSILLDDQSLFSLVETNSTIAAKSCPRCSQENASDAARRPTRRMKSATLENLHDQDLTIISESDKPLCRTWRLDQWQDLSLKAVLKGDRRRRCACNYAVQKKSRSSSSSLLPPEWSLIRSRAYKKFLSVFEFHHHGVKAMPLSSNRSRTERSSTAQFRRFDISILLQLAYIHGGSSPSVRACMLTCLDRMGGEYPFHHISLVKTCWDRYLRSSGDEPIWLRIYSEFVVECPVFDERTLCWERFLPVLKILFLLRDGSNEDEEGGEEDADGDSIQDEKLKWLFRCVAYILSRRFRLFQEKADDIRSEFQAYLSQLKIRFGESAYWVDDDTDPGEKERTFEALEKAGILGLVDLVDEAGEYLEGPSDTDDRDDDGSKNYQPKQEMELRDLATKSWPFHSPFDLRSCCLRIASVECSPRLSAPDHDMKVTIEKEQEEEPSSKLRGPPMLQCLDNDVFRLIFSFSGYKRLIKMREVCSLWKTIVDESNALWYEAYRTRFGFLPEDPRRIWGQGGENWKTLFQSQWLVARSVAFQRNSKGWKYRVCGYVGCHDVLRRATAEKRHYEIHDRKRRVEQRAKAASSCASKKSIAAPKSRKRGRAKQQPTPSSGIAANKSRKQSV